jgi:hypothetical protein
MLINGNVKLSTGGVAGAFEIQSAGGSTLMSRASIENDISSLAAKNTALDGDILTDKNSNDTVQAGILTEKNSDDTMDAAILAAKQADDGLDTNMGTLDAANTVMDNDVSSLASNVSSNDVVAKNTAADSGESSQTVSYGRTFSATPANVVSLRSSNASDPIIPCFVSAASTTQFTVAYGEEIPNGNYTLCSLSSAV